MKIRAPAKINMGLRIVGKRPDGYHLIDSLLVPISLYDEIEITKRDCVAPGRSRRRLTVTCDDPMAPGGERNIAYRAADILLKQHGIEDPIAIRIRKRIPVGAGLGGGSSDAAATLLGLNRFFRLRCSSRKLSRLALALGADVPFFIGGRPARVRGIGERLTPVTGLPRCWLVVLYPGFPVSTAWVYKKLTLTKPVANTSITRRLKSLKDLPEILVNDLEAVTLTRYPRISRLKQLLVHAGAIGSLMSGSGSSVFGVFNSKQQAAQAFERLRKEEGARAFLVHTLS